MESEMDISRKRLLLASIIILAASNTTLANAGVYFGVVAPTNAGRTDLVAAFLTGIDGVNKDG